MLSEYFFKLVYQFTSFSCQQVFPPSLLFFYCRAWHFEALVFSQMKDYYQMIDKLRPSHQIHH